MRRIVVALLVLAATALASDKPEPWVEVRSQHFIVVTNANEKQARSTAGQFERMRSVFHAALPKIDMDSFAPITVIAVKDDKNFKALEPEAYLAKNSLKLAGLFLHGQEKNYILLRLDSGYEHPYSVVYHEYTHLLTSKAAEYMPLWLTEGFAEFYQNTDIRDKDVILGQYDQQNLYLLQERKLLPLEQLFTIDHSSPYYHEQDKGSIFYAESWALTHYLMITDFEHRTHRLNDYLTLLQQKTDPVTAATQSFGDLKELQKNLEAYTRGLTFKAFKMAGATEIDEAAFQSHPLAGPQAAAVRADFLAYNERRNDSKALLDQVLKDDPQNVEARETLGYLAMREGKHEEARKWYREAVKLDSQSYLTNYYYGSMAMGAELSEDEEKEVETSLRNAIRLNKTFAPAYDRLAVFLAMKHRNMEEAHILAVNAVQLDPANVYYRLNTANILVETKRSADAVRVLEGTLKIATNDNERAMIDNALTMAKRYQDFQESLEERAKQADTATPVDNDPGKPPVLRARAADEKVTAPTQASIRSPEPANVTGPHKTITGTIQDVQCAPPAVLDIKLGDAAHTTALHANNYYRVAFSAVNFTPSGELHPCTDLQGMKAKVEYIESSDKLLYIVGVELSK